MTSSTTLLTGYVTKIYYEGSSCSNQYYAITNILNDCFCVDADTYRLVTATSSSVVQTTYTDSQCTKDALEESYSYTDGACNTFDSRKVYVSSSSVWNSDSVAVIRRWTNVIIVLKCHQILRCSYPKLLLQHPVDMHQATARAPRKQPSSCNIKWVVAYHKKMDTPLHGLCQVNPYENARNLHIDSDRQESNSIPQRCFWRT